MRDEDGNVKEEGGNARESDGNTWTEGRKWSGGGAETARRKGGNG